MKQRVFESRKKHFEDRIIFQVLNVSSCGLWHKWKSWVVFPHASKASTFWSILVLMVVEFEDASTIFCGRKSHLFGSCLFTHDWASNSNKKKLDGFNNSLLHQQDSAIETCLAIASARAVRLSPTVEKQKLKLELLGGLKAKLESLPVRVVAHEHLVRAGCMFFGTTMRRTLTRLHRRELSSSLCGRTFSFRK